ncbi:hypothetical protein [Actinophytocola sp. NPDC049390]|uniref:hypothetical protein n=1 Tax=Actinophytocola sp. NPDC049390 TaxID=3363894 RepID=UPI0037A615C6
MIAAPACSVPICPAATSRSTRSSSPVNISNWISTGTSARSVPSATPRASSSRTGPASLRSSSFLRACAITPYLLLAVMKPRASRAMPPARGRSSPRRRSRLADLSTRRDRSRPGGARVHV